MIRALPRAVAAASRTACRRYAAVAARRTTFSARASAPSLLGPGMQRGLCGGAETTVPVPAMGDSITEGTVVSFLKEVGEYAAEDEVVVQIETDKVTVDVAAPFSGTITSFCAAEEDTVEVGAELFKMTPSSEAPPAAPAPAPAAAAAVEEVAV